MAMVRRIAIAAAVMVGLAAHSATACPEGITLLDFHEDPPEPISTATIIVGTGYTDLGLVGSIAVGYVGGERSGWLFRGAHVKRVLIGAERRLTLQGLETDKPSIDAGAMDVVPTRFTATFGWFDDALFDLGLDVGFTATTSERMGALGRLTLGSGGVGVRLTFGGDTDGDNPDFLGGIDLVFDLAKMAGWI
jgi:hypothetical protein